MSKKDEYRLQLKLSPQEKAELDEAKTLSGARSYVQTVTEAMRRHLNVIRDQKDREDKRREFIKGDLER